MVKKLLLLLLLLALAVYLALAVGLLSRPSQEARCETVEINFEGDTARRFIDRAEVMRLLRSRGLDPHGQRLCDIDVQLIEDALRSHPLLQECECYRDAAGRVLIDLQQRTPVLHVLNREGQEFYVDSRAKPFDVPPGQAVRLPVVTGDVPRSEADSILHGLVAYLCEKGPWADSISQATILPGGGLEIALQSEDFLVYLGKTQDVSRKMQLFDKFYRRALWQIGTDKYSRIDLEFNNQVICTLKDKPGVDIHSMRPAPPPGPAPATGQKTAASASPAQDKSKKAATGSPGSTAAPTKKP